MTYLYVRLFAQSSFTFAPIYFCTVSAIFFFEAREHFLPCLPVLNSTFSLVFQISSQRRRRRSTCTIDLDIDENEPSEVFETLKNLVGAKWKCQGAYHQRGTLKPKLKTPFLGLCSSVPTSFFSRCSSSTFCLFSVSTFQFSYQALLI